MSKKEILAIAIKVFALWFLCQLFIQASVYAPIWLSLGNWKNHDIPMWAYFLFPVCFIFAGSIIALLLLRISNAALNTLSSDRDISVNQVFLLQVAGLFFVVNALTYLPNSASLLISNADIEFNYFLRPLGYIIQLSIGLWLLVHASWWVLLFNKLRGRA